MSFIDGIEPVLLSDELFVLNIPERSVCEAPLVRDDAISLQCATHFV